MNKLLHTILAKSLLIDKSAPFHSTESAVRYGRTHRITADVESALINTSIKYATYAQLIRECLDENDKRS